MLTRAYLPTLFPPAGHSKPVDVWAMGVITYFLLCGYTPFDRDTQQQEMEAIIRGDYKFEPAEYWSPVSEAARDFVRSCLTVDPRKRPTAAEALKHPWLAATKKQGVADPTTATGQVDLLPTFQKNFNAKKTCTHRLCNIVRRYKLTHVFIQSARPFWALWLPAEWQPRSEPTRRKPLCLSTWTLSRRAQSRCVNMITTPSIHVCTDSSSPDNLGTSRRKTYRHLRSH